LSALRNVRRAAVVRDAFGDLVCAHQAEYPWLFDQLRMEYADAIIVLAFRNAVLVGLATVAVIGLVRAARSDTSGGPIRGSHRREPVAVDGEPAPR
jgi:hypothetical protein